MNIHDLVINQNNAGLEYMHMTLCGEDLYVVKKMLQEIMPQTLTGIPGSLMIDIGIDGFKPNNPQRMIHMIKVIFLSVYDSNFTAKLLYDINVVERFMLLKFVDMHIHPVHDEMIQTRDKILKDILSFTVPKKFSINECINLALLRDISELMPCRFTESHNTMLQAMQYILKKTCLDGMFEVYDHLSSGKYGFCNFKGSKMMLPLPYVHYERGLGSVNNVYSTIRAVANNIGLAKKIDFGEVTFPEIEYYCDKYKVVYIDSIAKEILDIVAKNTVDDMDT